MLKVRQLVSFVTWTFVVSLTFALSCLTFCDFSHAFLLTFQLTCWFLKVS